MQEYFIDTLFYYRIIKNKLITEHYNELMSINIEEHSKLQVVRRTMVDLVKKQRRIVSKVCIISLLLLL